ncbi:MAG TPA: transglutaminase-like cysteine peptidase [Xanthobacteraceae bacterium]|nr:transglutaminase-like cysteine peptidase [Xanthobacteraceae bacterium]
MRKLSATILAASFTAAIASAPADPAFGFAEQPLFVSIGGSVRAPIGWVEFCAENPRDCARGSSAAQDAVLNARTWNELVRINAQVNDAVSPMTDQDHYGVLEKWGFPDDGYGDCEDYVLLKQHLLITAGWPPSALLITVVRDHRGDGHAVLTVKTDKGEFILDNQHPDILLWSETRYRYVKRQSQTNPNVWVALGDPRPAQATASSQ